MRRTRSPPRNRTALEAASEALSRRDHSTTGLVSYLAARGIEVDEARDAVERLAAAGYIDNARAASVRAESMAAREYGDEAIRIDLRGRELSAEEIDVAIAGLTPEAERARVIVLRDGPEPKTARRLAAKGFSEETVESAIGSAASSDL